MIRFFYKLKLNGCIFSNYQLLSSMINNHDHTCYKVLTATLPAIQHSFITGIKCKKNYNRLELNNTIVKMSGLINPNKSSIDLINQ